MYYFCSILGQFADHYSPILEIRAIGVTASYINNWPYPRSSKMRKLPIIHANVDLPVSGFAHVFLMQNAYKYKCAQAFAHWTLTTLRSVEFSDYTQLQRSRCKENRMQRSRQIWHLTVKLAILSMKSIELVITGRDN